MNLFLIKIYLYSQWMLLIIVANIFCIRNYTIFFTFSIYIYIILCIYAHYIFCVYIIVYIICRHILIYCISSDTAIFKNRVCDHPVLSKAISNIFPVALTNFRSLSHFGNSHNISNFLILIFVMWIYDQ